MPRGIPNNPNGRLTKKKKSFLTRSEAQKARYQRQREAQAMGGADPMAMVDLTIKIPKGSLSRLEAIGKTIGLQPEMLGGVILTTQLNK